MLRRHLLRVAHHYGRLFEDAGAAADPEPGLVFGADEGDAGTLRKLGELGFRHPEAVMSAVRAWQAGLRPAVRTARARDGTSNGNGTVKGNDADQPAASTDLDLGPVWLNSALEWPMALEARWLSSGRTLGAGLSLLAVLGAGETSA